MTQPIQEPSYARDLSGLGWGERQLARRPPPPATAGTIPVFAAATTVNVTAANNVQVHPTFEYYENGDSSVFSPTLSSGAVNKLSLLQRGVYALTFTLIFTATNTWTTECSVFSEVNEDWPMTQTFVAGTNDHVANTPTFSVTKQFPCAPNSFFGCEPVTSPYARLFWYFAQSSGVSKTIDQAYMHVAFIGPNTLGT